MCPSAISNPIMVTVAGPPTCATPTFNPPAGTYSSAQDVAISTTTPGATIYFTDDGSTPTYPTSGTTQLYTGPVTVSSNETLKAIAIEAGYLNSAVGSADYVIEMMVTLVLQPITPSSGGGNNTDTLVWNDVSADHYDIWRQILGAGYQFLATVSGAVQTYDDTGTAADWLNGQYDYYVLAKDSGDNTLQTSNTESTVWAVSEVFTIVSGDESVGPIPSGGAGEGFYDGTTNGGRTCGSTTVGGVRYGGTPISVAAYQQGAAYSNTIVFALQGNSWPQNYFTSIAFTDSGGNHYNLNSAAAVYSTSNAPGSTSWQWPAVLGFPFNNGAHYVWTVTP